MSVDHTGPAHTAEQVAARLGVSLGKVYGLLRSGELGHYRVGDTYRIPEPDLSVYLARVYVPAKPEEAIRVTSAAAPPRSNVAEEKVA